MLRTVLTRDGSVVGGLVVDTVSVTPKEEGLSGVTDEQGTEERKERLVVPTTFV